MPLITRFAPSPTGHLHLGHAYSAWAAWFDAKQAGGKFLLRIEDIDQGRCRPEYETAILEDLAWLGLSWEDAMHRQSDHMADYTRALVGLTLKGLIYPCFCTRQDIAREIDQASGAPHTQPDGPDGPIYPGICSNLSIDEVEHRKNIGDAFALRLHMNQAISMTGPLEWQDLDKGRQTAQPQIFGDVVLARKDIPTSYHLSVTLDDGIQGINRVVRGEDLFQATHVHRLLQALLGLETPAYHHHALKTDAEGRRYAKRDKALTIRGLRETGQTQDQIWDMAGVPKDARP